MTKTNIVVIGAGFAGVAATKTLSHKLKKNKDVTITLIDKHPYLTYMTELHEVLGGVLNQMRFNTTYKRFLLVQKMST